MDIKYFIIEAYQESVLDKVERIFYSNAMDYLRENDPTLKESLELADDFGFDIKDLDSERLASIHATNAESGKIYDAAKAFDLWFSKCVEMGDFTFKNTPPQNAIQTLRGIVRARGSRVGAIHRR